MDPVTGLKTAYKPMKGQHLSETEFVKNTEEKTTVIAGILYLDFETFPQPVNEVPTPPTQHQLQLQTTDIQKRNLLNPWRCTLLIPLMLANYAPTPHMSKS